MEEYKTQALTRNNSHSPAIIQCDAVYSVAKVFCSWTRLLLWNILTGKGTFHARKRVNKKGKGIHRAGEGIVRAGEGNMNF